jgi:hypothetical protein
MKKTYPKLREILPWNRSIRRHPRGDLQGGGHVGEAYPEITLVFLRDLLAGHGFHDVDFGGASALVLAEVPVGGAVAPGDFLGEFFWGKKEMMNQNK